MKRFDTVTQCADLEGLIKKVSIAPFFANHIPGWSLQENIDPAIWFTDREGPWEWKGPPAYERICVYGKFIRNKAAFISPEWFAELANYRRDGMSFEERVEAGEVPYREKKLYQCIEANPGELSKYAKRECGFSTGYDGVLTRLQMQTYVIDQDFRCSVDKHGRPYGWGNVALILPEVWLGGDLLALVEEREPEDSLDRIVAHLMAVMPDADESALRKDLK